MHQYKMYLQTLSEKAKIVAVTLMQEFCQLSSSVCQQMNASAWLLFHSPLSAHITVLFQATNKQ